jgi:RNA polymerase sigma-70 factor, ECF subfamily
MHKNDEVLTGLLLNPDTRRKAFGQLLLQLQPPVYRHIRRMVASHHDAADLLQNTFLKVWTGLDSFRSDASLYTWVLKIATNECLMFLRAKRLRKWAGIGDASESAADTYFNGDEAARHFYEAIATLAPRQKAVFNLRYFEELPYEEIAKVMGAKVPTLKATYFTALKRIENHLKNIDVYNS